MLAVIGVYGVLSFSVSQRTQEMGVRIALGAQRPTSASGCAARAHAGHDRRLVGVFGRVRQSRRVIRSLLYNVTPTDPTSFGGVAIFLLLVALAASYIPARRATAVDPIIALRNE